VLAMRVSHRRNPAHVAAVVALGLDRVAAAVNSAAAALFHPRPSINQPERLQARALTLAAQGAAQPNEKEAEA